MDNIYKPWREALDYCKNQTTYLLGNISTTNVTLDCTGLNHTNQRWIGVVRDQYAKTDQGNI